MRKKSISGMEKGYVFFGYDHRDTSDQKMFIRNVHIWPRREPQGLDFFHLTQLFDKKYGTLDIRK
jgi:hypothetical protein